jgi:aldose 1-epimerase
MTRTGIQYEIGAGDYRATIVEVGGGLRELWIGDRAVGGNYPADQVTPKCAGSSLVPWPNRIRDGRYSFAGVDYQLPLTEPKAHNAMHGLARWTRWTGVAHETDRVVLGVDIVPQVGWLFEVRCEVEYCLDADRGLIVTATATNQGDQAAPFGYGAHPYFALGDTPLSEVQLRIPAMTYLTHDDRSLPTGRQAVDGTSFDLRELTPLGDLRLDDCFVDLLPSGDIGVAEIRAGDHGADLWWDDAIQALQVFTLDLLVDSPAVAVEPMSCPPDAFNSGLDLVVLDVGARWEAHWGITAVG